LNLVQKEETREEVEGVSEAEEAEEAMTTSEEDTTTSEEVVMKMEATEEEVEGAIRNTLIHSETQTILTSIKGMRRLRVEPKERLTDSLIQEEEAVEEENIEEEETSEEEVIEEVSEVVEEVDQTPIKGMKKPLEPLHLKTSSSIMKLLENSPEVVATVSKMMSSIKRATKAIPTS
jgi:Txe/YoeB family toxin of Txe-Axe toxin-antitoxin module